IIVYDEVHRLLPKFGGSGEGLIQLERGAREFRKWGVGLVLISQVLNDFVGEIKANIGTEIQVRTLYEGDLNRISMKYGEDMVKSIVKAAVGTGMVENAEYNKGRPYFVSFRPLLHNPHRLPDQELEQYHKYEEIISDIEYQIEQLGEIQFDTFDLKLELKLLEEKTKSGAFKMVDIYLESIRSKLKDVWDKLGKEPKKKELELIPLEEIMQGIEKARKERKKKTKDEEKKETEVEKDEPVQ
ncbi:MAG TPA: hypothetical protein VFF28_05340, partial [Candidatus Nanoarchaeia archaeon]|nr:hypothetical protein [Candidatus Nanoarchaeia archaeon]